MHFSGLTSDKPIFPLPCIGSVPWRFEHLAPPPKERRTPYDGEICYTGSGTCGKALSDDFSRCSPLTSPPGNPLPRWKVGSRQGNFPVDWSEQDIFHESEWLVMCSLLLWYTLGCVSCCRQQPGLLGGGGGERVLLSFAVEKKHHKVIFTF